MPAQVHPTAKHALAPGTGAREGRVPPVDTPARSLALTGALGGSKAAAVVVQCVGCRVRPSWNVAVCDFCSTGCRDHCYQGAPGNRQACLNWRSCGKPSWDVGSLCRGTFCTTPCALAYRGLGDTTSRAAKPNLPQVNEIEPTQPASDDSTPKPLMPNNDALNRGMNNSMPGAGPTHDKPQGTQAQSASSSSSAQSHPTSPPLLQEPAAEIADAQAEEGGGQRRQIRRKRHLRSQRGSLRRLL